LRGALLSTEPFRLNTKVAAEVAEVSRRLIMINRLVLGSDVLGVNLTGTCRPHSGSNRYRTAKHEQHADDKSTLVVRQGQLWFSHLPARHKSSYIHLINSCMVPLMSLGLMKALRIMKMLKSYGREKQSWHAGFAWCSSQLVLP